MIEIVITRKSPLIITAERLKDIGAIVINQELIIICVNDKAHKILRYPLDYLYGKPISFITESTDSERDFHDEELLSLIRVTEKVIARQMSSVTGKFVSTTGGDGTTITLAMFYINDPISRLAGCYFIENEKSDDISDIVRMTIKLEELKNDLYEKVKERNINYKFNKTYKQLLSDWKRIGIGVGSVLLFTTGVIGLFVSGFIGNRFGQKPSEYYKKIEQQVNRKIEQEIEENNRELQLRQNKTRN